MIGQAISKQLKEDGLKVRLFTRSSDKAKSVLGPGFDIVEGDVFKEETLAPALKGVQGLYINLPEKNIADAVNNIVKQSKEASIEHIGYTSGCTVRKENAWHPMIQSHFEAENLVKKCGIAYSIFRLTMVLDTLPAYANKGKPFIIGHQPNKWSWVYSGDLAKMVSKAFQLEDARNKSFTVFGPDQLSIAEAVDRFNASFYPAAKKAKATPFWLSKLIAVFVGSKLKYAISIFKYFSTHSEEGDPTEANNMLGKPQLGVDQFLEIYGVSESMS